MQLRHPRKSSAVQTTIMYLVLRIAAILIEITFSDVHVCANCLQVIMNLLETCFKVISTPYIAVISTLCSSHRVSPEH